MDLRKLAAAEAVNYIKNNTVVGFGGGATIAYAIEFLSDRIKNESLKIEVCTSSAATKDVCIKYNVLLKDLPTQSPIDLYFDGCDQFDYQLNALKSGAGIHTTEKIFASLATEFILLGDTSKRTQTFATRYPVVVDVLPAAVSLATNKIKELFPNANPEIRKSADGSSALTEHGHVLIDVWFKVFPEPSAAHQQLKNITGIVETSLFIGLAHKAIIATEQGIETYI
jgi:ribose 5-phosphate isomerase A